MNVNQENQRKIPVKTSLKTSLKTNLSAQFFNIRNVRVIVEQEKIGPKL